VWRTIALDQYPNTAFVNPYYGFRKALVQGAMQHKITVYHETGNFGDFSKPYTVAELAEKLIYTEDDAISDCVYVRPRDLQFLELQEKFKIRKGKVRIDDKPQTVALGLVCTYYRRGLGLKLWFKYQEARAYLLKLYQDTKCYKPPRVSWQSPDNDTLQMSVVAALEQRMFVDSIGKTTNIGEQQLRQLKAQPKYRPNKLDSTIFCRPCFTPIDKQRIRTTVSCVLDLRAKQNEGFFRAGKGMVQSILAGSKSGDIPTYLYKGNHKYSNNLWEPINDPYLIDTAIDPSLSDIKLDTIPLKYFYKIGLLGCLDINLITGKQQFKIQEVAVFLPQGTSNYWQTQLGDRLIGVYRFNDLKKYWRKVAKRGATANAWIIDSTNSHHKMRYDSALDKGLFEATINWYIHRGDIDELTYKCPPQTIQSQARLFKIGLQK
jgi:hypothetical protein